MKKITTEKGELLLVEAPEKAEVSIKERELCYVDHWYNGPVTFITAPTMCIRLPEGYDTILGEITRLECTCLYPYVDCKDPVPVQHWFNTVEELLKAQQKYAEKIRESVISLLNSQGVYLTNTIVKPNLQTNPSLAALTNYSRDIAIWKDREESTLKEGNKYVAILKQR